MSDNTADHTAPAAATARAADHSAPAATAAAASSDNPAAAAASSDAPAHAYNHAAIEQRWQKHWLDNGTFRAADPGTPAAARPKYYVLDMFPYPSAAGLHIGHPEGYTGSDILARYKRARGFNVLHPMGWDAFGLPSEQHAIKTGQHPAVQTADNIRNFRRQLQMLGFAVDWSREVNTTDPAYFKWTQWIFLQLFKHGLAYVDEKPVWFCPALGTVLANEEVLNTPEGPRSERGSHPVERRPMRQWVLRITAYAEKLISGLDALDWPDSTKRLQKNWIGRSEGAEVRFAIADAPDTLLIYTTRPDTLYGATYMVIAPEHPLAARLTTAPQHAAVEAYLAQVRTKSDLERTDLAKDKSGVFTGSHAINPVNGARIPVWIADYVLMGYGTGAIMAVPAHDQRDWEFAQKYNLPILPVVTPPPDAPPVDLAKSAFEADGTLANSGPYDGLPAAEAKRRVTDDLAARGLARHATNYKLRDWLFSRQRYWGEPFPILWITPADYARIPADSPFREFLPPTPVTCKINGADHHALPLATRHLPLTLPDVKTYQPSPTGESPLARATHWLHVTANLTTGEITPANANAAATAATAAAATVHAHRETNTMPQWAGSCWYYLRYTDPQNPAAPLSPEKAAYWGTPDFYIGGAEHAVLHLLYARFWHRFLHDIGIVPTPEPFQRLFHQGIILGEDGEKMSKSRGNVVNPDDIVRDYGADALRLYLMFLGPLEATKPWNTKNIRGVTNFLRRLWRLHIDETTGAPRATGAAPASPPPTSTPTSSATASQGRTDIPVCPAAAPTTSPAAAPAAASPVAAAPDAAFLRIHHQTIQKVTDDLENLRFNTAISQLMIHLNAAEKLGAPLPPELARDHLRLLAPLAPHLAEELWHRLGFAQNTAPAADQGRTDIPVCPAAVAAAAAPTTSADAPRGTGGSPVSPPSPSTPASSTDPAPAPASATAPALASISDAGWPTFDPSKLVENTRTIIFQVNGKLRGQATLPADAPRETLLAAARADETVRKFTAGKTLLKEIIVPGKLVNLVIKD